MPPQDRLQVACDSYGAYVSGVPAPGEVGDEVLVTYEATRTDGRRSRNTEILTFRGDRICRAEVYFGWNLHA
jgi:hypothetical protein